MKTYCLAPCVNRTKNTVMFLQVCLLTTRQRTWMFSTKQRNFFFFFYQQ